MTDNKKWLLVSISVIASFFTIRALYLLVPEIHDVFVISSILSKQGVLQTYLPNSVGVLYPGLFWLALAGLTWGACYALAQQQRSEKHGE